MVTSTTSNIIYIYILAVTIVTSRTTINIICIFLGCYDSYLYSCYSIIIKCIFFWLLLWLPLMLLLLSHDFYFGGYFSYLLHYFNYSIILTLGVAIVTSNTMLILACFFLG